MSSWRHFEKGTIGSHPALGVVAQYGRQILALTEDDIEMPVSEKEIENEAECSQSTMPGISSPNFHIDIASHAVE